MAISYTEEKTLLKKRLLQAWQANDQTLIKKALDDGANINALYRDYNTDQTYPLCYYFMVKHHDFSLLPYLINKGLYLQQNAFPILRYAVSQDRADLLPILEKWGIDLFKKNSNWIIGAVEKNNLSILSYFFQLIEQEDNQKRLSSMIIPNMIQTAIRCNNYSFLNELFHKAENDSFIHEQIFNNENYLNYVEKNVPLLAYVENAMQHKNMEAFYYLVSHHSWDISEELLYRHLFITSAFYDHYDFLPLIWTKWDFDSNNLIYDSFILAPTKSFSILMISLEMQNCINEYTQRKNFKELLNNSLVFNELTTLPPKI